MANTIFKKVIGFSLLTHFVIFFLFKVQLQSPLSFSSYQLCRISFLGSILDESSLQVVPLEESKVKEAARFWFPQRFLNPDPLVSERKFTQAIPDFLADQLLQSYRNEVTFSQRSSSLTNSNFLLLKTEESPWVTLEGEIRNRAVLYQPKFSDSLKGIDELPEIVSMTLRFRVSKEGIVGQIQPVLSSGYTEVDVWGIRYLRQWRFVEGAEQEGSLRIHFSKRLL